MPRYLHKQVWLERKNNGIMRTFRNIAIVNAELASRPLQMVAEALMTWELGWTYIPKASVFSCMCLPDLNWCQGKWWERHQPDLGPFSYDSIGLRKFPYYWRQDNLSLHCVCVSSLELVIYSKILSWVLVKNDNWDQNLVQTSKR